MDERKVGRLKMNDFEFISAKDFVAGWVSGICSIGVGYPLETIKVRQQIAPTFGTASQQALSMLKKEGMRCFFRGLSYPLWTTGALNSLYFGFYANSLRLMERCKGEKHYKNCCDSDTPYKGWHLDCFWAGCVGGSMSTVVNSPIELAKTVLQAHAVESSKCRSANALTPTKYLMNLLASRGLRGWYHGGHILFVRDVPTFGLYAVIYEHVACWFKTCAFSHILPDAVCEGIAGGTSGVVTWFLAFPADVLKSRYMYDSLNSREKREYKGVVDCAVKTYKRYGMVAFYKGLTITLIRAFPVNLICFVAYEQMLNVLL